MRICGCTWNPVASARRPNLSTLFPARSFGQRWWRRVLEPASSRWFTDAKGGLPPPSPGHPNPAAAIPAPATSPPTPMVRGYRSRRPDSTRGGGIGGIGCALAVKGKTTAANTAPNSLLRSGIANLAVASAGGSRSIGKAEQFPAEKQQYPDNRNRDAVRQHHRHHGADAGILLVALREDDTSWVRQNRCLLQRRVS